MQTGNGKNESESRQLMACVIEHGEHVNKLYSKSVVFKCFNRRVAVIKLKGLFVLSLKQW